MSEGEMNSNNKPWLGGIYQKFEKMYDDIDHSSQDTVKFARNQLQTVGENVKKLGSHVTFDLPFPSFLASKSNSAPPLARKTLIRPKLNINVTDLEYPVDAKTDHLDIAEVRSPSCREFGATKSDLISNLIDDHWSSEDLEGDSKVEFDVAESSSLSSSTVVGQEGENETRIQLGSDSAQSDGKKNDVTSPSYNELKGSSLPSSLCIMDQIPSSSNAYESTRDEVDDVESWSPCAFMSKDQEDVDDLFGHVGELIFDHALKCAPNGSVMCQMEPTTLVSIFSSDSSLEESLSLVEASNSVDNNASSCTSTMTFEIPGPSNNSVDVFEDLLLEKVDLSDKVEQINLSGKVDRIQVSDKVDRIQRGVLVTNDMNFSMSSRRGCVNPYKKMFQNPFASKKRLEKDYKLLSVWYGDIDTELSEITQRKGTTTIVEHKVVTDDAEWEIV